jgi:hypothetical protein
MMITYNHLRLKEFSEEMLPIIEAVAKGECCATSYWVDCMNNNASSVEHKWRKKAQDILERIKS